MKKIFKYSVIAVTAIVACLGIPHAQIANAMDSMEKPSIEKNIANPNAMMMMMKAEDNQTPFSIEAFESAQASEKPFLIAFHKKGCPLCVKQQQALDAVYKEAAFADTKVLVVSYDNDTETLKKFNVGMQGTLILYKGSKEISRSSGLTTKAEIEKQIRS